MSELELILHLLLLLLAANGAPILARNLLGEHADWPIDGGYVLCDGNRLFGETKTWRGLVVAVVATSLVAAMLGHPAAVGALFGLFSLGGDLLSSYIKRRAGMSPSSRATGLDQLPEASLPLLLLHNHFAIDFASVLIVVVSFMLLEIVLSKLLFRWHIRRRPY